MKEPRIKIIFRLGYIELSAIGRIGVGPATNQKIFLLRSEICQEQQDLLRTFYERAKNAIVPKYNGKIPYKELFGAWAIYKEYSVRVTGVPTFGKVFTIMPVRANIDIGMGPGMKLELNPELFENEVKVTQLAPKP